MDLLLTGCFNYSETQLEKIRGLGYTIHYMPHEDGVLPVPPDELDAIVCNGLFLQHEINQFRRLKLIQLTSAGLDRVPVDKINELGIMLKNARGVYSTPMAEWAVFRILEYFKHGWKFKAEQEKASWAKDRELREVANTKAAIIGAGNVGQEVAKRLQAFGAETIGFDINTDERPGFDFLELITNIQNRIREFDIIVVTAPLLPSTKGLINRDLLHHLKADAIIVNIARGALIDQQALTEVLSERKDLFAALDVFEQEPLSNNSLLWKMENVAVSPHNSFVGNGNNNRMFDVIYNNLKEFSEQFASYPQNKGM